MFGLLLLCLALYVPQPLEANGGKEPPAPAAPPQFAESEQIQKKLLKSLIREKETKNDPRDPGHVRRVYVFSKKHLQEAFGSSLRFNECGFSYSGLGGERKIFLVGGTQWEVSQDSRTISLSARDYFKDNKNPALADGGTSPVYVVFPEGVCCQFDLQPFGMFLAPYDEKEFLERIGRIRLGSKWRPLPVTGFWLHFPGSNRRCVQLSPSGKSKILEGMDGRLEHSGYRFVASPDGKAFTVEFPFDRAEDKDRYFPIRVHRLPGSGKPAFWTRKGDDFLYLEPPNDQGLCTIRRYNFYNKGQWYEPLPPIKADAPFWPVGEYYWTLRDGSLQGLGGWDVHPNVSVNPFRPYLCPIESTGIASSIEYDLLYLPPNLINFDAKGFTAITWLAPKTSDVKKNAGSLIGQLTPPADIALRSLTTTGTWDLQSLYGDDSLEFVSFSFEAKTLLVRGVGKDRTGDPALCELHFPLSDGMQQIRIIPVPGLVSGARLLGQREGWFIFFVPGPEQRILCLCQETGFVREIPLPKEQGTIDPHQVEVMWGQEDLWPEGTEIRYWDVTRGM